MVRFKKSDPLIKWLALLCVLHAALTISGHPLYQSMAHKPGRLASKKASTSRPHHATPCSVYMPFDDDLMGHSATESFEPKSLGPPGSAMITSETKARGTGSLKLDVGGSLELPFAFNKSSKALSWCCYSHQGENNDQTSILLSKLNRTGSRTLSYSIHNIVTYLSVGLKYPNGLTGTYVFPKPMDPTENNGGFVQLCLTFDGKMTRFYQDNVLLFELPNADPFMRSPDPFIIGCPAVHSKTYIDEVLMCERALTAEEIAAHWKGRDAMHQIGLISPPHLIYDFNRHLHCHTPSCWTDPNFLQ